MMARSLLPLLGLLPAALSLAAAPAADVAQAFPELSPAVARPTTPGAPIPFTIANAGKLPVVLARVNGREGVFLVDTGAMVTAIDRGFADRAGLTDRLRQAGARINGKGDGVEFARIRDLKLGDTAFANFHALLIDLSGLENGLGAQPAGILGANVLLTAPITLDYAKGELRLGGDTPAGTIALPARFKQGSPMILAEIDGRPMELLIDTGATVSSLRTGDTKAPVKKVGERSVTRAGESSTEPILKLDIAKFRSGPLEINNPSLDSSTTHRCLGTDFFEGGLLHLDAARGIIAVRRAEQKPAATRQP